MRTRGPDPSVLGSSFLLARGGAVAPPRGSTSRRDGVHADRDEPQARSRVGLFASSTLSYTLASDAQVRTVNGPVVAIEVPLVGDERRKNWAKVVREVDSTKSSGWAYVGDFIAVGGIQDVPAGAVLLVYGESGSRANPVIEARVYRVNGDATLTEHGRAKGRAWARTLRDRVEELLGVAPAEVPDLSHVSDADLLDEVRRRGLFPGEPG